jgi:O-antigen/teichoic acid export membrane protein
MLIFAEELILLLATPAYLPYEGVFQVYALTILFTFLQYIYANVLICMDQEKLVARRYGAVLVINLAANLVLVWYFKALGAVVALLMCEITAMVIDLRFLSRSGMRFEPAVLGKLGSVAILCCAAGYIACLFPYPLNLIAYWVGGAGLGVALIIKTGLSRSPPA